MSFFLQRDIIKDVNILEQLDKFTTAYKKKPRLYRNKAITLYETRMRKGYVAMTCVMYFVAAILWYLLNILLPYMGNVQVSKSDLARLSRQAFEASYEQVISDEHAKERALLMPTSESTFVRRLKLVEDAQKSIDFLVYDSYDDKGSLYFYSAILCAADRGVKVRLILDGKLGKISGTYKPLEKMLQNNNNIEFYYFNELNLGSPSGLMVLCHDKIMVVDDDKMIVGGANMGLGAYTANYDMEVMITNSSAQGSVGQAKAYYGSMIKSGLVKRRTAKKHDAAQKAAYIAEYKEYYKTMWHDEEVDYDAQGVAVDKVTYLTNPISAQKKAPFILEAVFALAESSQKTTMVTPYALIVDEKIDRLNAAANTNTEFKIITNSLYNTRNVGYAQYYYNRESFLNPNLTLYEYQAENQLHAKMYTFDDRISVIGSFNLDERSAHIDTESVIVIDSVEFTAVVNEYIQSTFVNNSLQVGMNNEYMPGAIEPGIVPKSKAVKYALYKSLNLIIHLL